MNTELLKKLYCVYSPSMDEFDMLDFLDGYVTENIEDAEITYDEFFNMYVTKGSSEQFPCVVAHLDQVQRIHSDDFVAVETDEIIFGYSPQNRRFEGLGADDKNGIFIALECLAKYDCIKIAFFRAEEIGCVGSSNADMSFFADCRFVLQADRRGHADMVTNIGTDLCSNDFIKATHHSVFGYELSHGAMTDVETLKDNGLSVSCVNLSCGYYEPHTDREYTVKKDLENCLNFVQHIIEHCTDVYPHYPVSVYDTHMSCHDYFGRLDMLDEIKEEIMYDRDYYEGMSAAEIYDEFKQIYPSLSRTDVYEITQGIV